MIRPCKDDLYEVGAEVHGQFVPFVPVGVCLSDAQFIHQRVFGTEYDLKFDPTVIAELPAVRAAEAELVRRQVFRA